MNKPNLTAHTSVGDSPGSGRGGTVLALSARLRQRAAHAFAGRAGELAEVLCGPWARPRNPRRGFLTGNSPLDCFPIFLRLPKATKAAGASPPHPHKPFEKGLSENFTCLHPAFAEGPALGSRKKAACPVRSRTGALTINFCVFCPKPGNFFLFWRV